MQLRRIFVQLHLWRQVRLWLRLKKGATSSAAAASLQPDPHSCFAVDFHACWTVSLVLNIFTTLVCRGLASISQVVCFTLMYDMFIREDQADSTLVELTTTCGMGF